MARRLPGPGGRRCGARSRSPSAATSRSSSAASCSRTSRCPDGRDAFDYLVELCERGLAAAATTRSRRSCSERLQFELKTIHEMGFTDYFLIVWDFVALREAERDQRRPRPRLDRRLARRLLPRDHGRRPDPLRPALRALPQPGPQVDARRRTSTSPSTAATRVINYVAEKYGRDRVAQIITFGTMAARAAVRDAEPRARGARTASSTRSRS